MAGNTFQQAQRSREQIATLTNCSQQILLFQIHTTQMNMWLREGLSRDHGEVRGSLAPRKLQLNCCFVQTRGRQHFYILKNPWDNVALWKRNVPSRLLYLNTWSRVDGAVWEGCGSFRKWSFARGSVSLGWGFLFFSASCGWVRNVTSQLLLLAATLSPPLLTLSLTNLKSKQTLSSSGCIWPWCFITAIERWPTHITQETTLGLWQKNKNKTRWGLYCAHARFPLIVQKGKPLWTQP